jgi:hypothetical protein
VGFKVTVYGDRYNCGFFAFLFLIFESGETKEQQEIQKWCNEYMPELSIRACMDEAGL